MSNYEDSLNLALASLGSTVEDVRDTLVARGITGTHSAGSCPVATYLAQTLELQASVTQAVSGVTVRKNSAEDDEWYAVENPLAVAHFVSRFDNYEFPELDVRHVKK